MVKWILSTLFLIGEGMGIVDIFLRKRRTKVALGIVWPLICLYCMDEAGKIDERLESDRCALAYIYGALCCTIKYMNVGSDSEAGWILLKSFRYIFPVRGDAIFKSCVVMLESSMDTTFSNDVLKAYSQIEAIKKLNMKDEAVLGQAISRAGPLLLQKHFKEHYR
jgi:hypothetical protein